MGGGRGERREDVNFTLNSQTKIRIERETYTQYSTWIRFQIRTEAYGRQGGSGGRRNGRPKAEMSSLPFYLGAISEQNDDVDLFRCSVLHFYVYIVGK